MKVDIYINVTQNVTLSIVGGGELHLSGFFEPQREDMDENMFLDEDEEDEEEEELVPGVKVNQNLKQAKANALKNAKGGAPLPDSDEDDDEEDEDDDEEDEDDDEESSEDAAPAKAK